MSFAQNKCTSCGKLIAPGENAVYFKCPACGSVTISRCERCRQIGMPYRCVKCNWEGP
ncbi:MAG: zinc finger domain-containing protein [Promethearchaeota archaeon]